MTKIRFKELNNKSRKGLYLYIKNDKQKGSYYKYDGYTKLDIYKQYHEDRINGKTTGSLNKYKKGYNWKIQQGKLIKTKLQQQIQRIKKNPRIQEAIKKGISSVTIKNIYKTSDYELKQKKQQLLKDLVIDKGLLELITTDENIKKIAHRLEYRLNFKDKKGNIIGSTGKFNKIPKDIIKDIKSISKEGQEVSIKITPELEVKLKEKEFLKYQHKMNGKIKACEMIIIFRKGK